MMTPFERMERRYDETAMWLDLLHAAKRVLREVELGLMRDNDVLAGLRDAVRELERTR